MTIASAAFADANGFAAALVLAADAPAETPASVAVQVALIGALAPIVLVVINEIFKRWRSRPNEERDGVLAPVEEVPRDQYDKLLEVVADQGEQITSLQQQHALDRMRWDDERHDLLRQREAMRERCEQEGDELRDRLASEIERRARAEAKLEYHERPGA